MMRSSSIGDANWLMENFLLPPTNFPFKYWALALSGHAAVGKTSLAEAIVRRWPDAVRLESEYCIIDLDERRRQNVSGCTIASHDIPAYRHCIKSLLDGQRVSFYSYDWKSRSRKGNYVEKKLVEGSILILDGTVTCHPDIAAYCNQVVFLKPANYHQWLEFAIARDINERWRGRSLAALENQAKYEDASEIEHRYESSITDKILVKLGKNQNSKSELIFVPGERCSENINE